MALLELLDASSIKIGLESTDKEECFEELIALLVGAGRIADRERALDAIYAREEMDTTGIGNGVGIPHGKDESIRQITAAAGTSRDGIEFESKDGKPVHLVFLVLAEKNNPGPHLQTLSEIAMVLHTPGQYDKLVNAKTAAEFRAVLGSADNEDL